MKMNKGEAINVNQGFCIDKKVVKQLFKNCNIKINFKRGASCFYEDGKKLPESERKYKILYLSVSKPYTIYLEDYQSIINPLLNLYSIDKKYLSEELKVQFAQKVMPIIFSRYLSHRDDDIREKGCEYSLTVYISKGKIVMEESNAV